MVLQKGKPGARKKGWPQFSVQKKVAELFLMYENKVICKKKGLSIYCVIQSLERHFLPSRTS